MSNTTNVGWTRDELMLIVEKWLDIDGDRDRLQHAASELEADFLSYSHPDFDIDVSPRPGRRILRLMRTMSNITGTGRYEVDTRRWYANFFRREFYGNEQEFRNAAASLHSQLGHRTTEPHPVTPYSPHGAHGVKSRERVAKPGEPERSPTRRRVSSQSNNIPRMIVSGSFRMPPKNSDEHFVASVLKAFVLRGEYVLPGPALVDEIISAGFENPTDGLIAERSVQTYGRILLGLLEGISAGVLGFETPRWNVVLEDAGDPLVFAFASASFRMISQFCGLYGIELESELTLCAHNLGVARVTRMEPISPRVNVVDSLDRVDFVIQSMDRGTTVLNTGVPRAVPHTSELDATNPWDSWPAPRPIVQSDRTTEYLRYFLREAFNFRDFRDEQYAILERALLREDVIGLLPTGGGKSLTFQLAGLLMPGTTVVISPLVALIDDQIQNLNLKNIDCAVGLHSSKGGRQTFTPETRFIYFAPERLHVPSFRQMLDDWLETGLISQIVVDEAHCVSEWGHDFRTSYLSAVSILRRLVGDHNREIPVIALTGTASNSVLIDIQRELEISRDDDDAIVSSSSFNRPNLQFIPVPVAMDRKRDGLAMALAQISGRFGMSSGQLFSDSQHGGLVFCTYAGGTHGTVQIRDYLIHEHHAPQNLVQFFAGKNPSKSGLTAAQWSQHKYETQRKFKQNQLSALVTTKSFGMGIDKPNIRYTIHYGVPPSLEALAQEAGRAGRDGRDSYCAVVFSDETVPQADEMFSATTSEQEARRLMSDVGIKNLADASRYFRYLMSRTYPGVEKEVEASVDLLRDIRQQLGELSNVSYPVDLEVTTRDDKAIFRMIVLGVIDDYLTLGFGTSRKFRVSVANEPDFATMKKRLVSYVERYDSPERAAAVGRAIRKGRLISDNDALLISQLIGFSYEVIEASRRQAIGNTLDVMRRAGTSGDILSRELAEYLDHNVFTAKLAKISMEMKPSIWWDLLNEIDSVAMGVRLSASARRELENSPYHPGLHAIAAIGETYRKNPDMSLIAEHITAAAIHSQAKYGVNKKDSEKLVLSIFNRLRERLGGTIEPVLEALFQGQFWDPLLVAGSIMENAAERVWVEIAAIKSVDEIARSILQSEGFPA